MTTLTALDAVVDDAVLLSYEHQLQLMDVAEQLGRHDWNVDLNAGTLTLTGQYTLQATAHLLGTTSEEAGSWLWGWANESGFPPHVMAVAGQVAAFGQQQGIAELAQPEVALTPDIATRLTDAAKVITGHWTSYSGAAGPGTQAYFLIDAPPLALPAPSSPRFLRLVSEALSAGLVRDHRRALASYTRLRGLQTAATDGGATVHVRLPDGDAAVTFDHAGRITNLSGRAGPA